MGNTDTLHPTQSTGDEDSAIIYYHHFTWHVNEIILHVTIRKLPIIPALFSMFWSTNYAKNYATIINHQWHSQGRGLTSQTLFHSKAEVCRKGGVACETGGGGLRGQVRDPPPNCFTLGALA